MIPRRAEPSVAIKGVYRGSKKQRKECALEEGHNQTSTQEPLAAHGLVPRWQRSAPSFTSRCPIAASTSISTKPTTLCSLWDIKPNKIMLEATFSDKLRDFRVAKLGTAEEYHGRRLLLAQWDTLTQNARPSGGPTPSQMSRVPRPSSERSHAVGGLRW
jgi:hypothetical protein